MVAFLAWAHWATLDEVTRGEGRVIPSRQIQVVQNLEGGIIAAILVREGEVVDEGPGADADRQCPRRHRLPREARPLPGPASAATARLRAEIDETAPVSRPRSDGRGAGLAENELALFRSRQTELEGELDILRRQEEQRGQELNELRRGWPSSTDPIGWRPGADAHGKRRRRRAEGRSAAVASAR